MITNEKAWESARKIIKEQVSEVAYETWIKDLKYIGFKSGTAILYTSSTYHRDIIVKRFESILKSSFEEVLGRSCSINVCTKEELEEDKVPEKPTSPIENLVKEEKESDNLFTFENFIVGGSNKFAHAASIAVANNPGGAYNPLFIYGNSGLGKTHLLKAIKNEVEKNNPKLKVSFVTCEDFTNEFLELLRAGKGPEFRNRYRPVDVLLIDDIQFIGGKIQTEEEFLNTFNSLYENNKQIVLTSDRPPKEIQSLADRLRTRFESGLLADIQQPDYETRVAIVKKKGTNYNIEIPDDVAEYIATRLKNNTRQLEGAVKKLVAYHMLSGETLSLSMAQTAIKDILVEEADSYISEESVLEEISRTFSISVEDICSEKQTSEITKARQISAYVMQKVTNLSTKGIGDVLGGRDHSTIVYSIRKIENVMKSNPKLRSTVNDIIKNIKGRQ